MATAKDWLPAGIELALESVDAPDLDGRAERAGVVIYRDGLVERRRREYLAGRLAAGRALQALGVTAAVGREGALPTWPPGVSGSISHSGAWAAAVVARSTHWRALGLDLEGLIAGRRITVVERVMTAVEITHARADGDPWIWTRTWSAKEAAYKCLSAMGVDADLVGLVPRWTDAGRGELMAWVSGEPVRLDLRWCIDDALLWMLANPSPA